MTVRFVSVEYQTSRDAVDVAIIEERLDVLCAAHDMKLLKVTTLSVQSDGPMWMVDAVALVEDVDVWTASWNRVEAELGLLLAGSS